MAEPEVIEFDYLIRQVKTMADHSINIVLNLPEYEAEAAAEIMRRIDGFGRAALVFQPETLTNLDDETKKVAKKSTTRVGRRRS